MEYWWFSPLEDQLWSYGLIPCFFFPPYFLACLVCQKHHKIALSPPWQSLHGNVQIHWTVPQLRHWMPWHLNLGSLHIWTQSWCDWQSTWGTLWMIGYLWLIVLLPDAYGLLRQAFLDFECQFQESTWCPCNVAAVATVIPDILMHCLCMHLYPKHTLKVLYHLHHHTRSTAGLSFYGNWKQPIFLWTFFQYSKIQKCSLIQWKSAENVCFSTMLHVVKLRFVSHEKRRCQKQIKASKISDLHCTSSLCFLSCSIMAQPSRALSWITTQQWTVTCHQLLHYHAWQQMEHLLSQLSLALTAISRQAGHAHHIQLSTYNIYLFIQWVSCTVRVQLHAPPNISKACPHNLTHCVMDSADCVLLHHPLYPYPCICCFSVYLFVYLSFQIVSIIDRQWADAM